MTLVLSFLFFRLITYARDLRGFAAIVPEALWFGLLLGLTLLVIGGLASYRLIPFLWLRFHRPVVE